MSKVIDAVEMKDAEVEFISIVSRAANRSPFKILKKQKENAMINLNGLFRTQKEDKGSEDVSIVVGLALSKDADVAGYTTALKAQELTVVKSEENEDANVLLFVEEYDAERTVAVKLDDEKAVLVSIAKGFNPWPEGSDFLDNIKTAGVLPSISVATDTFMDTMVNALYGADMAPVDAVTKACDDFKTYVVGLVKAVPEHAFKLEKLEVEKTDTEECAADTADQTADNADATADAADTTADNADAADVTDTTTVDTADNADAADAGDTATPADEQSLHEIVAAQMTASLEKVKDFITEALTPMETALTAKIDAVGAKADEAIAQAKKAEDLATNTVSTHVDGDHIDNDDEPVQKSDLGFLNIDTAYGRPE